MGEVLLVTGSGNSQRRHFRFPLYQQLLVLFAAATLSAPALAAPPQQQRKTTAGRSTGFEVAAIRMVPERDAGLFSESPSGAGLFTMRNVNLQFLIGWAFDVESDRVLDGPDWIDRQLYDVSARPAGDAGMSYEQLRPLVQQLLRDRFHLACHRVTKDFKGYDLIVTGKRPSVTPTKGGATYGYLMANRIDAQNVPMGFIASILGRPLRQPVEDKTGLKGNYDFHIKFAPFDAADSSLPSIFTVVEQLGLKLQKQKNVPEEILVIDHVDRVPTPN